MGRRPGVTRGLGNSRLSTGLGPRVYVPSPVETSGEQVGSGEGEGSWSRRRVISLPLSHSFPTSFSFSPSLYSHVPLLSFLPFPLSPLRLSNGSTCGSCPVSLTGSDSGSLSVCLFSVSLYSWTCFCFCITVSFFALPSGPGQPFPFRVALVPGPLLSQPLGREGPEFLGDRGSGVRSGDRSATGGGFGGIGPDHDMGLGSSALPSVGIDPSYPRGCPEGVQRRRGVTQEEDVNLQSGWVGSPDSGSGSTVTGRTGSEGGSKIQSPPPVTHVSILRDGTWCSGAPGF